MASARLRKMLRTFLLCSANFGILSVASLLGMVEWAFQPTSLLLTSNVTSEHVSQTGDDRKETGKISYGVDRTFESQ